MDCEPLSLFIQSCKRKKKSSIKIDKAKSSVYDRAEELQSSLDPKFPSFIKLMLPSHVSGCFWLGLPAHFSSKLPKEDFEMTLLDEAGKEYKVKCLPNRQALSGGWRAFATTHRLVQGDALVFHLVKATKFKVYIIRSYGSSKVDDVSSPPKSDALARGSDSGKNVAKTAREPAKKRQKLARGSDSGKNVAKTAREPAKKRPKFRSIAVPEGDVRFSGHPLSDSRHIENHTKEVTDSEVLDSKNISNSNIEFRNIITLENFSIKSSGLIIDSEIKDEVRTTYYKLCCSQNSFLHEKLIKGLNSNLVAGIISETVNIADLIKDCKLTTSEDEFTKWEKSLKAFKELGMNVDFLLTRLGQLVNLASDSKQSVELKKYREALMERTRIEDDITTLVRKLIELKDASKMFEKEFETLEVRVEEHESKFQAAVNAPWCSVLSSSFGLCK